MNASCATNQKSQIKQGENEIQQLPDPKERIFLKWEHEFLAKKSTHIIFAGHIHYHYQHIYDYQPLHNMITNLLLWYTIYYQHINTTIIWFIPFIYHFYTIYIPFIYHLYSIYIPFIRYYTYYDYQHIYHAFYHFAVKTLRHPCGWWRSLAI